jgi:hypothetical protein
MRKTLPFRAWYYFRMGYGTYMTFIVATINVMVTVYYLAIKNIPDLQLIFPNFTVWFITLIFTGGPLAVFLGWLHLKKSPAFRSETEVGVEANPYYYKLPPGFWKDALVPVMLQTMKLNIKLLNKETLSEQEIQSLKELQNKMEHLIDGGYIGSPKHMISAKQPEMKQKEMRPKEMKPEEKVPIE